jgi:hypothetical protein
MTLVSLSARSAVVLATLALLAAPALAQGTAQERSACMGDAFKFCASHIPIVSAIEACLEKNVRELTPACRAEFEPAKTTKMRQEHFR